MPMPIRNRPGRDAPGRRNRPGPPRPTVPDAQDAGGHRDRSRRREQGGADLEAPVATGGTTVCRNRVLPNSRRRQLRGRCRDRAAPDSTPRAIPASYFHNLTLSCTLATSSLGVLVHVGRTREHGHQRPGRRGLGAPRDFTGWHTWLPRIVATRMSPGGEGGPVGSVRHLTLSDGSEVTSSYWPGTTWPALRLHVRRTPPRSGCTATSAL